MTSYSAIEKSGGKRQGYYTDDPRDKYFSTIDGWISQAAIDKDFRRGAKRFYDTSIDPSKALIRLKNCDDIFIKQFANGLHTRMPQLIKKEFGITYQKNCSEYLKRRKEVIRQILSSIPVD